MRIVSLLPAATDIVAELGLLADLVGRTHECDWPVGGHHGSALYDVDTALLAELAPDAELTQGACRVL